jgi:hypothetical protein
VFSKNEFKNFEISGIVKIDLCVIFSNLNFSDTVAIVLQQIHVHIGMHASS